MAVFKFYNVQMLPLKAGGKNIGINGYKHIFEVIQGKVENCLKIGNLADVAFVLRNDFHIAPKTVEVRDDIAFGTFMKYDEVHKIVGTLSDEEKYVSNGGDSSKKFDYDFVFDFNKHILAIHDAVALPAASVICRFIEELIDNSVAQIYPEHRISVTEMTDAESLDKLFDEAQSYKKVEVDVTFSNSEEWDALFDEDISSEIEKELKEKGIDAVKHEEKAAKQSTMTLPSNYALGCLGLACKYGNAQVTYVGHDGKRGTYKMLEHSIKETVEEYDGATRKGLLDYALDVKAAILKADFRAKAASTLSKVIRRGPSDE